MDQPRDPRAPIEGMDAVKGHAGPGRHGPISGPAIAGTPGAPRSNYGCAFVAPPRIPGRGDRNATRRIRSPTF